ncbi:hypothetical protein BGI41_00250 [Methanobrevibacter sp. 87.7]|nr:hypothetical protein BGI41_00250 [Methanobrevibacter sp. 87.7]
MVLIVFLSIGAICATDVDNNDSVVLSNSSVNSIQTVTNDTVTNSVNTYNSTNAMLNSNEGSSSSSIVSSDNYSSSIIDNENSSSLNSLDANDSSSTISNNSISGVSNSVSDNITVLNNTKNNEVSSLNKLTAMSGLNSAIVNNTTVFNNNTFGVFLFGSNMNSVDLSKLYANHVGNIFLNYYAVETYGIDAVESFIKKARLYNINVYIWMQCFYDGGFINPATSGQSYWTQKINEAKSYAELQGVAGITLDYLRFPGTAYKYANGTKSITLFTQMLTAAVKEINSNMKVAAIIMPETSSNAYYYGQDSDQLGNIVDIIMPMVYKGNYQEDDAWIKSTTNYFKSHSGNADVWTVLQSYDSDSNIVKLSSSVLSTDSQYALDGGADGVAYFRYLYFNVFNMTSLNGGISSMNGSSSSTNNSSSSKSFTIDQIVSAAKTVKAYYATNGKLPSTVTIGSVKVSLAQFLYYESKAISQLNSGNTADIAIVKSLSEPSSPNSGDSVNGNLYKAGYVDSATRTYKFILNYNQGPNYSTTTIGRVSYNRLIEAFSVVLDYYGTNKQLPSFINVKYNSRTTTSSSTSAPTSFTVNQIVSAAKTVKAYYINNGKLPSSVTIGSVKVSLAQFLYYESRAISQLNDGNTANIAIVKSLSEPSSPNLGDSINSNLTKAGYVDSATRTYKFILNYNQGPNYSTTTVGRVSYNKLIETFADVLISYESNNKLPTSVVVNTNEVVGNYTYFTVLSNGVDGTYFEGNNFSLVLKDALGNGVNNKNVVVNLNNRVYNLVTDNNGIVYLVIPVLNNGNYNVSYSYTDSNSKLSSNGSTTIKVIKNITTIKGNDLNTTSKSGAKFNVTLKDAFGNPISNQNIQFRLNNSTIIYNATTNSNGVASLAINLIAGDYTITYTFVSNNQYPGVTGTSKIHVVNVIPTSLSIDQIVSAAKVVKEYYATNGELPSTVTIGSVKVSLAQFLYYESRAISQLNSGNTNSITIVDSLDEPSSPNLGDAINGNLNKADYVDSATRTYKFILNYEQGPNYSTTTIGRVSYNALINAFSVILDYYGVNKKLPANISIKGNITTIVNENTGNTNSSNSNYLTIDQIVSAAKVVKEYYAANGELPSTVTIGSVKISLAQFLYYESRAISQLNSGNTSNIAIIGSLDEPSSPNTGDAISDNLNLADYVDSATRTYKFILNYEQGPNYSTTALGKVSYNALIEAFSRVLAFYGNNDQLPNYVVIDTDDDSGSNADTSSIAALAKSLTAGLSSQYDMAVTMFNWVRDNVVYDYYYNSQQGAALTLTRRSGNCCDQSNLYVAMCRAVGVTIRYVHGYCQFTDGWYGHVWTEVYVNGKWYSADCISTRNTFGVINNWNTNTVTIYNRYTNLPF